MTSRIQIAGVGVETSHWIGGEPAAAGSDTFTVFSPIDGAVLGEVSAGSASEVDRAVSAARSAFRAWASLGPEGRGRILDRFAQGIVDRKEELAAVETVDNGSLLVGNLKRAVDRAAHNIAFFSELARAFKHEPLRGQVADNHVRHEPAGVAALITPWNTRRSG